MLVRQPEKRATLEEIASDPWLVEGDTGQDLSMPLVSRQQLSDEDHTLIVQKMVNGKIATKEEIVDALDKNEYNHITATYFLLAERKLRSQEPKQVKSPRMETLPPEMMEEIGQYLTPRDLASCIAVSRRWRNIFNNDSLWQQHCDPSLVEPLEKTPSVVEPRFVSPEVETSTLTPISYWRMAFLREKHLWKNYKWRNHKKHEIQKHNIPKYFLSNTLIVIYFHNRIEIWDVSTVPASIIASVNIEGIDYFKVYRTNRLLFSYKDSLKVFHVDPSENNVIELIHDISIDSYQSNIALTCVSGSTYVYTNSNRLTLDVIDLENGIKIKSESCPVTRRENQNATITSLKSSTNSDYVIVSVHLSRSVMDDKVFHLYVYRVGQLAFSSGPIFMYHDYYDTSYTINGDYLAVRGGPSLKIYNCLTSELVSESTSYYYDSPHVFNDSFVCLCESSGDDESCIGMFSLASKSWTTVSDYSLRCAKFLQIINNKFIRCTVFDDYYLEFVTGVWEASGQTLKRSDIPDTCCSTINKSFTRGISDYSRKYIYYYW